MGVCSQAGVGRQLRKGQGFVAADDFRRERRANDLFRRNAEHLTESVIDKADAAHAVATHDNVSLAVEQFAIAHFAVAHFPLHIAQGFDALVKANGHFVDFLRRLGFAAAFLLIGAAASVQERHAVNGERNAGEAEQGGDGNMQILHQQGADGQ